ncbi:KGW motif small protein [Acinetobacter sp. ANC 4648]|nr:KGW motif small protein [Acinetobacter sp. ANC 4648]
MIKTVNYSSIDKVALRQKGWMLFSMVVGLQVLFVILGYMLNI